MTNLVCAQGSFCFVELNCENLFDCQHDSLKNDYEYCEGGTRRWNKSRYWRKLNNIARELISCGGKGEEWIKPDLIALVEVENDSVLTSLTRRSLLYRAYYDYVMTESDDVRGIDVALLYNPFTFTIKQHRSIKVSMPTKQRNTRDILYVEGMFRTFNNDNTDTLTTTPLHVFVVHAPSRRGGEHASEPLRMRVSNTLCHAIDSIQSVSPEACIIVAGDFNDYYNDKSVKQLEQYSMRNVSSDAIGKNGARGTYRYRGEWGSLDHIIVSDTFLSLFNCYHCCIYDEAFVTEPEPKYGGIRPRRTYNGFKYDQEGFSDHLPLIFNLKRF